MADQDNDRPQDAPARKETVREILLREMAKTPRWKETPKTGQGFEIIGAKKP